MFTELVEFFGLGLAATGSPCVLPLYPGFLAYLGASSEQLQGRRGTGLLGLFVLAGVLTMMITLGLLIAALRTAVGRVIVFITPLAGLLIIILGVLLLFDKNVFARLPQVQIPALRSPFASAYGYGLLYGPIAFPCSGPFLVTAFALSVDSAVVDFLAFGLGFGVPLLALSLLARTQQRRITQLLTRHSRAFNLIAGVILIVLGAVNIIDNWETMLLFLGLA
ncbi:MAG: cytochrome c biogenesis CcdA family protein [Thermodesulfobacteriota bacterium]